jgi:hypothetical protein
VKQGFSKKGRNLAPAEQSTIVLFGVTLFFLTGYGAAGIMSNIFWFESSRTATLFDPDSSFGDQQDRGQ